MDTRERGQILPMVMICLVIMMLIISGLVNWLENDTKWAVKEQKSSSAINLAEAAIDRGQWKLQSTTSTWNNASLGLVTTGYNFDTTYSDIPGGTYRIKFSPAANNSVTIVGEGRDLSSKEVRAVSAVYQNTTIYSPLMAGGGVTWAKGLIIFWGPIMSQGDITLMDDVVASLYYPRKFAKGVVVGTAAHPRDTNGPQPPNTDNIEWWSQYSAVPNVPVLDFATLKSSAIATGTYNVYGCRSTFGALGVNNTAVWDTRGSCSTVTTPHAQHFGNPWCHPKSARNQPNTDYVWYWDGDVTLSGDPAGGANKTCGLRGTVVVRGNLTIDTPGEYSYIGHVPANAWMDHQKFTSATNDTAASGEYPADIGLHQSTGSFHFGVDSFSVPGFGAGSYTNTIGIRGFTYVGGNLNIINYMDFNGAVWVNGTVTSSGGTLSTSCGIFYNDTLQVPVLNVILSRTSWTEIGPSTIAWP